MLYYIHLFKISFSAIQKSGDRKFYGPSFLNADLLTDVRSLSLRYYGKFMLIELHVHRVLFITKAFVNHRKS